MKCLECGNEKAIIFLTSISCPNKTCKFFDKEFRLFSELDGLPIEELIVQDFYDYQVW